MKLKTFTVIAMVGAVLQIAGAFYLTRLINTPFLLIGLGSVSYFLFFVCLFKNQK